MFTMFVMFARYMMIRAENNVGFFRIRFKLAMSSIPFMDQTIIETLYPTLSNPILARMISNGKIEITLHALLAEHINKALKYHDVIQYPLHLLKQSPKIREHVDLTIFDEQLNEDCVIEMKMNYTTGYLPKKDGQLAKGIQKEINDDIYRLSSVKKCKSRYFILNLVHYACENIASIPSRFRYSDSYFNASRKEEYSYHEKILKTAYESAKKFIDDASGVESKVTEPILVGEIDKIPIQLFALIASIE